MVQPSIASAEKVLKLDGDYGAGGFARLGALTVTDVARAGGAGGFFVAGSHRIVKVGPAGARARSWGDDGVSRIRDFELKRLAASRDGGLVVLGSDAREDAIIRLDSDGAVVSGFGEGGSVRFPLHSVDTVEATAAGGILLAGQNRTPSECRDPRGGSKWWVGRLTADGSWDSSFSGDGYIGADVDCSVRTFYEAPVSLDELRSGQIIMGWSTHCLGCPFGLNVSRIAADGSEVSTTTVRRELGWNIHVLARPSGKVTAVANTADPASPERGIVMDTLAPDGGLTQKVFDFHGDAVVGGVAESPVGRHTAVGTFDGVPAAFRLVEGSAPAIATEATAERLPRLELSEAHWTPDGIVVSGSRQFSEDEPPSTFVARVATARVKVRLRIAQLSHPPRLAGVRKRGIRALIVSNVERKVVATAKVSRRRAAGIGLRSRVIARGKGRVTPAKDKWVRMSLRKSAWRRIARSRQGRLAFRVGVRPMGGKVRAQPAPGGLRAP